MGVRRARRPRPGAISEKRGSGFGGNVGDCQRRCAGLSRSDTARPVAGSLYAGGRTGEGDADGVVFWVAEENGRLLAVMGIQDKGEVALIRHAYVTPSVQRRGMGTSLLRHVQGLAGKPVLIGSWAASAWAMEFYLRTGFTFVPSALKDRLPRPYW